jgi:nicotinic acid mononucleotide adenylyltransferase
MRISTHAHLHPTLRSCTGIISPVHDAYGKAGLAKAAHRLAMCERAVERSPWVSVSRWVCAQSSVCVYVCVCV